MRAQDTDTEWGGGRRRGGVSNPASFRRQLVEIPGPVPANKKTHTHTIHSNTHTRMGGGLSEWLDWQERKECRRGGKGMDRKVRMGVCGGCEAKYLANHCTLLSVHNPSNQLQFLQTECRSKGERQGVTSAGIGEKKESRDNTKTQREPVSVCVSERECERVRECV